MGGGGGGVGGAGWWWKGGVEGVAVVKISVLLLVLIRRLGTSELGPW